jgi:chemotaxis protein histidine kinase CheA
MVVDQYASTDIDAELAAIAASLAASSLPAATLQSSATRLGELARAAEEASQDDLCQHSQLLAGLLVIAGNIALADPATDTESAAIVAFVRDEVSRLRAAFRGPETPSFEQAQIVARQRWGEWLTLAEPLLTTETDSGASAGEDWMSGDAAVPAALTDDCSRSDTPSTQEIERLLAALSLATDDRKSSEGASPPTAEELPTPAANRSPIHEEPKIDHEPPILDRELFEAFREDAERCLGAMEATALAAESEPHSPHAVRQVCRELHTLKGASASVGLNGLAAYLHEVEEALQPLQGQPAPESTWRTVLETVDRVRSQLARLAAQSPSHPAAGAPAAGDSPAAPRPHAIDGGVPAEDTVRIKASQLDRLLDMLAELVMLRNRRESRVAQLKQMNSELLACVARLRLADDSRHSSGPSLSRTKPQTELASDILEVTRSLRELYEPISQENHEVSRFIQQFRQELVQLSRLPVSSLFHRLQRVAHDAAQAAGKKVQVEFIGDNMGLDRSLQERLYEPLLHIVRNGVSHGIENEPQRVAAGKQPRGTITLAAQSGANLLILEVRDDGQGLNYEAIHRRGIERGLISPDRTPTQQELSQLIFAPGFSTRDTADRISGRGVGMDVVEEALRRLRGWVEVQSTRGQGTRIRLFVPLRSVIEHVMVFRARGQLYGVPLYHVHRTGVRQDEPSFPDRGNVETSLASPWPTAVNFADLFRTGRSDPRPPNSYLVLDHSGNQGTTGAAAGGPPGGRATAAQPIRSTVFVDEIIGPEEVVVRPLPPLLRGQPYCSGVTLAGSGEILLLLDGHQLGRLARQQLQAAAEITLPPPVSCSGPAVRAVLVADDSLSARRVLSQALARHGWRVTEAMDGVDAIERLRAGRFALVCTDIEMPRTDGFGVLEFVKSCPDTQDLPVIMISSRTTTEFRDRATALGAAAFLAKPLCEPALVEILDRLALCGSGTIRSGA